MLFLNNAINQNTLILIIIWASILLGATLVFFIVLYYARRYTSSSRVYEVYVNGKRTKKRINYRKIGAEVKISSLKLKKSLPNNVVVKSIESDSDIKQGTTSSFIMPTGEVTVYYGLKEEQALLEAPLDVKKVLLPVSKPIFDEANKDIRPVLLLSSQDAIDHIEQTNSDFSSFPLVNQYRYTSHDQKEVLVCYVGEVIYGVIICSEAVFKYIFRCDMAYVKENLSNIDSEVFLTDDIYSIVLDSSFKSIDRFLSIMDHTYQYALLSGYELDENEYTLKKDMVELSNSLILSYNERISKEFDPVYDKAIQEANRYKQRLLAIKKQEEELDKPFISPKDKVYAELEKVNEAFFATGLDKYELPLEEITDGPYVENKVRVYVPRVKKTPSIEEELNNDIAPYKPSKLNINNFIDYIMSRKDMVSLTIDVSDSMKKKPTTMCFMKTDYFGLIYKGKTLFKIIFKFDIESVKQIKRKHPHIKHVLNGNQEDWYLFSIDDTFASYEELYDIAMKSYTYTKELYYKNLAVSEGKK